MKYLILNLFVFYTININGVLSEGEIFLEEESFLEDNAIENVSTSLPGSRDTTVTNVSQPENMSESEQTSNFSRSAELSQPPCCMCVPFYMCDANNTILTDSDYERWVPIGHV